MDSTGLLKEFAKEKGIDEKEVDRFLARRQNPRTLEAVKQLPHDLLNHVRFISYLDECLQSFISYEMWCERYKTITLDDVLDKLEPMLEEAEGEELEKLKEIESYIITSKFGSVVYDW